MSFIYSTASRDDFYYYHFPALSPSARYAIIGIELLFCAGDAPSQMACRIYVRTVCWRRCAITARAGRASRRLIYAERRVPRSNEKKQRLPSGKQDYISMMPIDIINITWRLSSRICRSASINSLIISRADIDARAAHIYITTHALSTLATCRADMTMGRAPCGMMRADYFGRHASDEKMAADVS